MFAEPMLEFRHDVSFRLSCHAPEDACVRQREAFGCVTVTYDG
jgi:hypothetical protein